MLRICYVFIISPKILISCPLNSSGMKTVRYWEEGSFAYFAVTITRVNCPISYHFAEPIQQHIQNQEGNNKT